MNENINQTKEIIFVTSNNGKRASALKYFNDYNLELKCFDYEIIEPDINDIECIAASKVLQAYEYVESKCISLDSGFYIPGYPNNPNFPGAFPKREIIEKMGIEGLLENMKDIENRYCYFKDCLAYYDGREIRYFYGISPGTLSKNIRKNLIGTRWSDLWYVFVPFGTNKTLAEMTDEERNNLPGKMNALEEFARWYTSENEIILKK